MGGIAQGSRSGQLLYFIYANDLTNTITNVDIIAYADDVLLVLNGENMDQMINIINETLKKVSMWCIYNKLTINPHKCKCVVFTNRTVSQNHSLTLDNKIVQITPKINYLCTNLDSKLSFCGNLN